MTNKRLATVKFTLVLESGTYSSTSRNIVPDLHVVSENVEYGITRGVTNETKNCCGAD